MNKQEKWLRKNYDVIVDLKTGNFFLNGTGITLTRTLIYGGYQSKIGEVSGLPTNKKWVKPSTIEEIKDILKYVE